MSENRVLRTGTMRIKNARDQHLANIYLLEKDWTSCKEGRRRFSIGSWIANIRKIESSHETKAQNEIIHT